MSWSDIRFWTFLAVWLFLIDGTPDVWDRMHDYAMHVGECK